MAPHSSTLAWKIPWTEEPGRLQSMGLLSWTQLSKFTFTFHFHAFEKEMATHSSVLAWRIPGTGEPGGLLSMGSHRVGHDWNDLAAAAARWSFGLSLIFVLLACHTPTVLCFPVFRILFNMEQMHSVMASLTQWTWVWVNSGSWWWTGRPGMLRFMGLQRVGHDWATDLIWSDLNRSTML